MSVQVAFMLAMWMDELRQWLLPFKQTIHNRCKGMYGSIMTEKVQLVKELHFSTQFSYRSHSVGFHSSTKHKWTSFSLPPKALKCSGQMTAESVCIVCKMWLNLKTKTHPCHLTSSVVNKWTEDKINKIPYYCGEECYVMTEASDFMKWLWT